MININNTKIKIYLKNKIILNKKYNTKLNNLKLNNNLIKNFYFFKDNIENLYKFELNSISEDSNSLNNFFSQNLNFTYYDSRFSQFESYLSSLNLYNTPNLSKFNYKYKYSLITKIIPFLIKSGNKLFTVNNYLKAMSNIYNILLSNNSSILKNYSYINEFKYYIMTTKNTNNINFLLNWITIIYKPVFDIKAFNVPKISKKKNDKTLLFKIIYLPEKNRLKTSFKHISLDIKKNNYNSLNHRISDSFLDILLNYKKSYLYSRKMYIYQQVMDL